MAKIGEKRPAEEDGLKNEEAKMATPSPLTVLFKPSPLANVASNLTTYSKDRLLLDGKPSPKRQQKFTFSEVNDAVKSPVKFTAPSIMKTETPRSLDNGSRSLLKRSDQNGGSDGEIPAKKSNLFMDCISQPLASSESSKEREDKAGFLFGEQLSKRAVVLNQSESTVSEELNKDSPKASGSGGPFGSVSQTTVVLPTVETVTGEEGERHVTQVSCSLFAFDSSNRTWKERGRGELRLNDTPKSEGAYQSRLIMRTCGSRRVCLNTHLWSTMICERASKKTIRITAQENVREFGVYLIKGAPKDITNLHAAICRRLDALRIASSRDCTEPHPPQPLPPSFDEDHDSVTGDRPSYCSSPESSPERLTERPTRYDGSSPSPSSPSSSDAKSLSFTACSPNEPNTSSSVKQTTSMTDHTNTITTSSEQNVIQ